MLRHRYALARTTVLSLVFAACSSASGAGGEHRLAAGMGALGPRVVLLYADVSASVPDTAWHASLRLLSRELRAGDRVALFALGGCHRTPKCGHDGTLQNRPRRRWGEYAWRRGGRASVTWGYASGVVLLRRRSR
jgi:hypothetical protein